MSVTGVSVLYLLCDLTVDKYGLFKVDVILAFFVEIVPSIVIGVVGNSGMDSVGCITVEISLAFIVEKVECLIKDLN